MSNEFAGDAPQPDPAALARADHTIGSSTIYRLCEEVIALREMNNRQHKVFEQALSKTRDEMRVSLNSFAGDTQRAYQQLRQEVHGEKRVSLALLNELLDLGMDLEHIVASRPPLDDHEAMTRWADAVEIQCRKVQAALGRHGIQPYDAVLGAAYNPAIHERVGSKRVDGMDALRIAEQRERGYASQQPEFVLRRPKVIVSE
jgi:molecular chaperone GrpE (heat shock protein)